MEHNKAWENYFYPGTSVLINRLDITDAKTLSIAERRITALTIAHCRENPVKGDFDLKHLCRIHKEIFGDLYPWAGKIRNVEMAKTQPFTKAMLIPTYAEEYIFSKLKIDRFLTDVDPDEIVPKLTYYLSELNVLHPFREGNGRTQRIFIEYLAKVAGFAVDFSTVTPEENLKASIDSYYKEYRTMNNMFERITKPIPPTERIDFCEKIASR
ncbi:MAG: Fic family protein [Ruminococcus sp.]|jgi:cell filamentation protein|nr:Fic family protein [Ruminococcus sp.]